MIELAPSILSADFARLAEDALAALAGGGTLLHFAKRLEVLVWWPQEVPASP